MRNTTAIFIINLSVSDLLFCCFNLPLAASVFLTRRWIWGPKLCQLYPLLRYGLLGVSVFNILAITINRYVMIAHPYIYNRYSNRNLNQALTNTNTLYLLTECIARDGCPFTWQQHGFQDLFSWCRHHYQVLGQTMDCRVGTCSLKRCVMLSF